MQRDIYTPVITGALCTIAKVYQEPKWSSIDEWMKMCYIYICIWCVW